MWLRPSILYGRTVSSTSISLYLNIRTFEASFQKAISTSRMRADVAQGGIISPVLFSLYVNEMPSFSRHVKLAVYADDTAVIATSRQPALLVKYLETYLSDLERWLSEWTITINVSKRAAMIFAKTSRRIPKPRSAQLFGEPIQWVDDTHYLGVTFGKRLTWSKHRSGEKKSGTEAGSAGASPEQEKRSLHQEWCSAV